MNRIRQYVLFAFLIAAALLPTPVAFADEATGSTTQNSGSSTEKKQKVDCSKEVKDKVSPIFRQDAQNMNAAIESWHKIVDRMLSNGCRGIVNDNDCKGTYINTDGSVEDLLDGGGSNGDEFKMDLKEWNKIDWTDHDYSCAERKANGLGNKTCADIAAEMKTQRDNMQKLYDKMKHEAAMLTRGNLISCEVESCDNIDEAKCSAVDSGGNATEGVIKDCKPINMKLAELELCPLCDLFVVILNTDQNIATKSFDALASSFRNVIIMVMGLYIAYHTLLMVGAFTKQDAPKYIMTMLTQAFKVLVAALLLSNSAYIYQNVIDPLMIGGMNFGEALLFQEGENKFVADISKYQLQTGKIGIEVLQKVMMTVQAFSNQAARMPAIGGSLVCVSVHEGTSFVINFSMFIQGLLLYVFGWMILLAAGFYLLDSVVRFGIFCALIPFLVAAWPFKVTRSYTMAGWKIFINSFFNFVMMGLVLSVCLQLTIEAVAGVDSDTLIAVMNGNEVETLKKMMDMSTTSFLVTLACCMFAFKLVKEVGSLASEISGTSGGSSIGAAIGGTAANVAKRVAGAATGGVAGAAGKAAGKVAGKATKKIAGKIGGGGSGGNNGGSSGGDGDGSTNSGSSGGG